MTGKKTIWVYLEDAGEGFIPAYKELCTDTVRRFAGNIEHHIISSKNIEEYLPGSQKDSHFLSLADIRSDPRLKRDYIQALVLEKHGGLWIDADILVTEDIRESTFDLLERYDLVTARELNDPLTLILSRPGGSIIREWRARMEKEIQDPQQAANWERKGASIFQKVVNGHQAETAYFEDQGIIIKAEKDPGVFFTNTIKTPLKTFLKDNPAFISLSDLLVEPRYDKFDAFNYWSREKIFNEDLLISSLFRSVLHSEYHLSDVEDPETDYYKQIGVIVPTIDRSDCLTDLVKSVNNYFPGISVYIGIQGEIPKAQRVVLEGFKNVALYDLPYDYGLSATRNFLVKEVREKYILLCDDDFVFTEQTDLKLAYKILRSSPEIKIVGGLLLSYNYGEDSVLINKQYTSFISLITRRTESEIDPLVIPFEYLDVKRYFIDAENYYTFCDSVINYALIDKTIFHDHGLWWDEQFKIRGEHLDFYLRLQKVGAIQVVFTNALFAEHHRRTNPQFEKMRYRPEGQINMMEKWKMANTIILGTRVDRLFRGQYDKILFRNVFSKGNIDKEKKRYGVLVSRRVSILQQVDAITSSLSWQATKPLRDMFGIFRSNKRNKDGGA